MRKPVALGSVLLIGLAISIYSIYQWVNVAGTNASPKPTMTFSPQPVVSRPILATWFMSDKPFVSDGAFTFAAHMVVVTGEQAVIVYSLSGPDAHKPLDGSSVRLGYEASQPDLASAANQAYPAPSPGGVYPPRITVLAQLNRLQVGAITFRNRNQGERELHVLLQPPLVSLPLDVVVAQAFGPPEEAPALSGAPYRDGYLAQAGYRISFNGYGLYKGDRLATFPSDRPMTTDELLNRIATEAAASPRLIATATPVPVSQSALELSGGKPIRLEATLSIEDIQSRQAAYLYIVFLMDGDVKAVLSE